MTEESYEVSVPDEAGPSIRVTRGGEDAVNLQVTEGTITTNDSGLAHAVSIGVKGAGPVVSVTQSEESKVDEEPDRDVEDKDEPAPPADEQTNTSERPSRNRR